MPTIVDNVKTPPFPQDFLDAIVKLMREAKDRQSVRVDNFELGGQTFSRLRAELLEQVEAFGKSVGSKFLDERGEAISPKDAAYAEFRMIVPRPRTR
jgi:hypothetical protein